LCEYSQGLPRQETPNDSTPIMSGLGKATNVKFGRYIQSVHANKIPLKIWENRERGRIQGLPKFLEYPQLSQEWVKLRTSNLAGIFTGSINFKFCTHILSINRNKCPLQISGKVAGGVCEDSRNFSGHPYIGRIARLSLR